MNTLAILKKQGKDTLKNLTVLIQFVLFPVLTMVMSGTITGMPENFFVNLFATMYIGMAPLTSMAAIIAEEKEKNTLRVLLAANVKPWEYLLGVGSYVFAMCMLGAAGICAVGTYRGGQCAAFLGVMAVGILISLLIGAAIGTGCKSQMMATSVTLPVMMTLSFLPMLSMFNSTFAKIARFTYTEQISRMLAKLDRLEGETILVLVCNFLLAAGAFAAAYRQSRLV